MAEPDSKEIITEIVSKLKPEVKESSQDWFPILEEQSEERITMENKENDGILKMRSRWSSWVLFFIGVILVFDIVLVWQYGTGRWTFKDPTVVIVVITDNFLKIFGLGYLITREIFKKIYQ